MIRITGGLREGLTVVLKINLSMDHMSRTPRTVSFVFLLVYLVIFTFSPTEAAVAERGEEQQLSLAEAVSLALKFSPLMTIGRFEVKQAQHKADEALGKIITPQVTATSYSGLVSEARGDVSNSPDESEEYDDLGPFFKLDVTVVQPLYTFGKYSAARDAGLNYQSMQESKLRAASNNLSFEVIKAYLGVTAGTQGLATGHQLTDKYQFLVDKIQTLLESDDPTVSDSELLEAQSMLFDIEQQATKTVVNLEQSTVYLCGLLNRPLDKELRVKTPNTPDFNMMEPALQKVLDYARSNSWALKSIESGVLALQQKAELETNMKYPDIFLAAGAGYGYAPNRDKQVNPFISDDYNYQKIGAVLGMKWDFNFSSHNAREQHAAVEYLKAAEQQKLATLRLDGEVRNTFSETKRYWHLLTAVEKSLNAARTWTMLESDNFDMGIGEVKRLITAYRKYFQLKADEIETRYNYLLALTTLAKSLGNTELCLQWEQNGLVQLP